MYLTNGHDDGARMAGTERRFGEPLAPLFADPVCLGSRVVGMVGLIACKCDRASGRHEGANAQGYRRGDLSRHAEAKIRGHPSAARQRPVCGDWAAPQGHWSAVSFAHYRIRALLYAGEPNWALLATVTPR